MRLGPYTLTPFKADMPVLTLAPMAGVGNCVFRLICARLGARIVGVEFVNCRNIDNNSYQTRHLLNFSDAEIYRETGISLIAPQIYGNDADLIAAGAHRLEALGAQIVDINFGCSVPRIVEKGSGAAYLRDLDRLYQAVHRTVETVQVPVTVKARIGWDESSINILDVVRRVQEAGAVAIAIHPRTVRQQYKGRADWSWIGHAKEVATIPVIGNGDVRSCADAVAMQRQTGCDAVMIGRAAMANPWIFSGRRTASLQERIDLVLEQLQAMAVFKGDRTGLLETRKHLTLYFKDLPRSSSLRRRLLTTDSLEELVDFLHSWRQQLAPQNGEIDLTLSQRQAEGLAWGGNG